MNPDPWLSLVISGFAAVFAGYSAWRGHISSRSSTLSAETAAKQYQLQLDLQAQAVQPSVWVDVGEHPTKQGLLALRLKCEGPTAARNVRLEWDGDLPHPEGDPELATFARAATEAGISYLAPGRELLWTLGVGARVLKKPGGHRYTCTLTYDGPRGPVEPIVCDIDLDDWRTSNPIPAGSLNEIKRSIDDLTKAILKR